MQRRHSDKSQAPGCGNFRRSEQLAVNVLMAGIGLVHCCIPLPSTIPQPCLALGIFNWMNAKWQLYCYFYNYFSLSPCGLHFPSFHIHCFLPLQQHLAIFIIIVVFSLKEKWNVRKLSLLPQGWSWGSGTARSHNLPCSPSSQWELWGESSGPLGALRKGLHCLNGNCKCWGRAHCLINTFFPR